MLFDWDPVKNRSNGEKHDINFRDATQVFSDPDVLITPVERSGYYEQCWIAIGMINAITFAVVFTDRPGASGASFPRERRVVMNDSDMVTATLEYDDDGTPVVRTSEGHEARPGTNWARLAIMTDEEVEANALSDPDNPPLTEEQLARAQPLPEAARIRLRLRMTQERFADRFGIPLDTLRDWEQERSQPDTTALTLLRVIAVAPDVVAQAVAATNVDGHHDKDSAEHTAAS